MSKKLTKTIILIVFVVFLGINKVNAASDSNIYKTCTYGYSSPNKEISVSIMKDFQQIKVESVNLQKAINILMGIGIKIMFLKIILQAKLEISMQVRFLNRLAKLALRPFYMLDMKLVQPFSSSKMMVLIFILLI